MSTFKETLATFCAAADALRAELAKPDAPAAAPDGWQLVPVEPTPEMLKNAMNECGGIGAGSCGEHVGIDFDDLRSVFDAMLAAAPGAPTAPAPTSATVSEPAGWRAALQFYADREHFNISDEGAWDTVSGEPANFWCDEAGTANVEDGTVAAMALRGTPLADERAAEPGKGE